MNIYDALALAVDALHLVVIICWIGGLLLSIDRYPRLRRIHAIFAVSVLATQILLGFRCPLVLLSGYLRELAHPGYTDWWLYQPFIVKVLQKVFGFTVSDVLISVIMVMGTAFAVTTLIIGRRPTAK